MNLGKVVLGKKNLGILVACGVVLIIVFLLYNVCIVPYKLKISDKIENMFVKTGNGKSIEITDTIQISEFLKKINDLELHRIHKMEPADGWSIMLVIVNNNKQYQYTIFPEAVIFNQYVYTNEDNLKQITKLYSDLQGLVD